MLVYWIKGDILTSEEPSQEYSTSRLTLCPLPCSKILRGLYCPMSHHMDRLQTQQATVSRMPLYLAIPRLPVVFGTTLTLAKHTLLGDSFLVRESVSFPAESPKCSYILTLISRVSELTDLPSPGL